MKYECEACGNCVHYPISLPFSSESGYLCYPCFRYLSIATVVAVDYEFNMNTAV